MNFKLKVNGEYLYYYLFFLMLLNNWCSEVSIFSNLYVVIKPLILGITVAICIALMVMKKYKVKELVFIFLLILLGAYSSYLVGTMWIFYTMILISFSKGTSSEKIVNIAYKSMSIFIIVSLIIFIFQFIFAPETVEKIKDGSRIKYSLALSVAANEAARYWIYWVALFEYIYMEKNISRMKQMLIILGTIFFYFFTWSDALLLVPMIIMMKKLKKFSFWERFIKKNGGSFFALFWAFSVFILFLHETKLFYVIDIFFTGRLVRGLKVIQAYGITGFGRPYLDYYKWILEGTNEGYRMVVDNAYYMIMIQYGIIYLIIISFIFLSANRKANYQAHICFIMYSIFALAENNIFAPTAIFPVILASQAFWEKKRLLQAVENYKYNNREGNQYG